jgi:hypothetical protein
MKPSSLTAHDFAIYTATTLIGIGTLVGGGLLLAGQIRKAQARQLDNSAMDSNSAAGYARRLKMAFENDNPMGWGTNEKEIFAVFTAFSRKSDYKAIQSAYRTLYASDLNPDLQSELSSADYGKVVALYNKKPA